MKLNQHSCLPFYFRWKLNHTFGTYVDLKTHRNSISFYKVYGFHQRNEVNEEVKSSTFQIITISIRTRAL